MKLKALVMAALLALGVTAAVAVAKPPPGRERPAAVASKHEAKLAAKEARKAARLAAKGLRCRGGHVNLAGAVASVDPAASSFALDVKRANRKGRALVGTQATILVGAKTKLRRFGKALLGDLEVGDRARVLVRSCRDAEGDAALLAKLVVARGEPTADDESSTTSETETSETETSETSETETTETSETDDE